MSWDRTLPQIFAVTSGGRGTPLASIAATSLLVMTIVIILRDIAVAGAAASLIFLVTFAFVHCLSIVARRRGRGQSGFRAPLFPVVPLLGGFCCAALALFQGQVVPSAGLLVAIWLAVGGVLFIVLFARRARVVDASSEARDPELVRWRGRSPLVLVPIANPAHAEAMVDVARALAPPEIGRVLLLSVAVPPAGWNPRADKTPLQHTQHVLSEALLASVSADLCPEALTTVAAEPWPEIRRVAQTHRCESVLLGLGHQDDDIQQLPVDTLIGDLDCDVVVLHAHKSWHLSDAQRILVPHGGRGGHDQLRARLIGSLMRTGQREVTFLRILAPDAATGELRKAERELEWAAHDEAAGRAQRLVVEHRNPTAAIIDQARDADLLILGAQRSGGRKSSGRLALEVARSAPCPLIVISRRG
jgi:nucleotide-binding universal stress UspA family protein